MTMSHRLFALTALLLGCGCGSAQTPAPQPVAEAPTPPHEPLPMPTGVTTSDVSFARMETPEVLAPLGVVQFDSDGQQTCGVTDEGRIFCAHPDGRTFELTGFPEAIAVEVGSGCGEPLCIITRDDTAVCVTTRHGNWDPGARIEMPAVRDISLLGCFGCAVSLDGHLACFGGRQDHMAFLSPPRLVVGLENVVDVEVEADQICAQIGRERITCAPQ